MAMKTRYTVIDGEVIAEERNGVRKLYVPDPLGSTVALLDNTQTQTDTFAYWPYGEDAGRTGTTPTPLRFVGTWGCYRDSSAKTYMRARILDTAKSRWLTEDPIGFGGGWNVYCYVSSNPENMIDPSGEGADPPRQSKQRPKPGKNNCVVKTCEMYGWDGDFFWGEIPTHKYVCATTYGGYECSGGLMPGNGGMVSPVFEICGDHRVPKQNGRTFPIQCKTQTVDCQVASATCLCLAKLAKKPPHYSFWHNCYRFIDDVDNCVYDMIGKEMYGW